MSLILMTTLFYKVVILQGEIWRSSLLELKGLRRCSHYTRQFLNETKIIADKASVHAKNGDFGAIFETHGAKQRRADLESGSSHIG